jgi:hypothetical protein
MPRLTINMRALKCDDGSTQVAFMLPSYIKRRTARIESALLKGAKRLCGDDVPITSVVGCGIIATYPASQPVSRLVAAYTCNTCLFDDIKPSAEAEVYY